MSLGDCVRHKNDQIVLSKVYITLIGIIWMVWS